MAADDEFITIVPVGEGRPSPPERDPAFVTVLTVGAAAGAAEVLVRRPRGARLGLGLKFEGGSAAAEKVRRLLVQSCATDSPAANATTPWGKLIPGDEILAIDGAPVSDLTRIDCVRRLKDSDEVLKLLVRHLENEEAEVETATITKPVELQRPTCLPPPVPPRKLNKKNSFKDRPSPIGDQTSKFNDNINGMITETNGIHLNGRASEVPMSLATKLSRKSSFDSHIHRQAKESLAALKKSSPEEVRRLVRRLSDGKAIPPEAEVYMDLLSQEWERCLALADAESDDTGSSISTVVDRLGSVTSSVENSIPSTPIMQPKTIDIQKVLNCIENIDSDLLKDIASTRFGETPSSECRSVSGDAHVSSTDEIDSSFVPIVVDETVRKKIASNDKNNNNTIVRNVTCISIDSSAARQVADRSKPKTEVITAKPRPLPRSTRPEPIVVEKQAVEATASEREGSAESEVLLTPTKKNCIENWLQRSEAELVSKRRESAEETAPEALPRLIDFVPKPHYRSAEMTAERAPPPKPVVEQVESRVETRVETRVELARVETGSFEMTPPPPESREDGSGASLDTIGELDEGTDATTNEESGESEKNAISHEKYDSAFWEGRTNRIDVEDSKSLSNDETPPSCPRQPPDGVETPCDAIEKTSDQLRVDPASQTLKTSSASLRLQPRLPHTPWPASRGRTRISYSRSQDARSECSVKDKIAMFSVDRAASVERVEKYVIPFPVRPSVPPNGNPSPAHKNSFSEVQTLDRRLTKSQDNLDEVPRVERSYRHVDKRPEVLGAHYTPRKYSESTQTKTRYSDFETTPIHYGSTTNLMVSKPMQQTGTGYHARSISDDSSSAGHKSTLEYLIEQRKKSMSKLRGLMIPEMQGPIVDLPEIKVQECNAAKSIIFNKHQSSKEQSQRKTNPKLSINLNDSWKMNILPNNIPKYSPAFKRKSLQVYPTPSSLSKESTPERKLESPLDSRLSCGGDYGATKHIPTKPPRTSIEIKKSYHDRNSATLPSRVSLSGALKLAAKNDKSVYDKYREYGNVEVKVCTTTDIVDSDNDSAVSSTQSSYRSSASSPLHNMDSVESDSSHLSPRSSHYISYSLVKTEMPNKPKGTSKLSTEYEKRSVCRSMSSDTNASVSSSAGSAATSGSQASCSSLESSVADSGKKKVTRTHSVDTINRRNILASAKCRSGRDLNVGSPVVETKFTHESPDRSPSPQRKSSDRLTTLASNVSGLSNKGESRRIRSKVIADSDSDSESEVNIRQRKSEFKTARLKKNSMKEEKVTKTESTRKQNDAVADSQVVSDEVPMMISQRIIKEIKKAGLHDDVPEKKHLPENNNHLKITTENALNKSENGIPNGLPKAEAKITIIAPKAEQTNNERTDRPIRQITKTSNNSVSEIQLDSKSPRSYKVCLKKGVGSGVGLILAGGIDCEAKSVTVHKVLAGSVAEREGLQRGVRVRSINGRAMDGLTHAETVAVLKEPRSEVIIEIEEGNRETASSAEYGSDIAESRESDASWSALEGRNGDAGVALASVTLEKAGAGAGLGFGLDGGKDSPSGDRPLTIKKLFAGGAAARSGRVLVGAELVSAGGRDMRGLTRTQAWAALKELPTGPVLLLLRNPC